MSSQIYELVWAFETPLPPANHHNGRTLDQHRPHSTRRASTTDTDRFMEAIPHIFLTVSKQNLKKRPMTDHVFSFRATFCGDLMHLSARTLLINVLCWKLNAYRVLIKAFIWCHSITTHHFLNKAAPGTSSWIRQLAGENDHTHPNIVSGGISMEVGQQTPGQQYHDINLLTAPRTFTQFDETTCRVS